MTAMRVPASNLPMLNCSASRTESSIGDRGVAAGTLEYRHRRDSASVDIPAADPVGFIRQRLGHPA